MTNEDSRKTTAELKDVAAGRQLDSADSGGSTPGPDPGDGRTSIEDLEGAVGARLDPRSPSGSVAPPDDSPNPPPGEGLGIEPLENTVAGRGRTQTTSGTPDATPDPGNDDPPSNIGGGTDISQIPNQTG